MNGNRVPVWSSPQTTAVGVVQCILMVAFVLYKLLVAKQPLDEVDIALVFTQLSVSLTAIFARDNNKSSEDVGVTDRY